MQKLDITRIQHEHRQVRSDEQKPMLRDGVPTEPETDLEKWIALCRPLFSPDTLSFVITDHFLHKNSERCFFFRILREQVQVIEQERQETIARKTYSVSENPDGKIQEIPDDLRRIIQHLSEKLSRNKAYIFEEKKE